MIINVICDDWDEVIIFDLMLKVKSVDNCPPNCFIVFENTHTIIEMYMHYNLVTKFDTFARPRGNFFIAVDVAFQLSICCIHLSIV